MGKKVVINLAISSICIVNTVARCVRIIAGEACLFKSNVKKGSSQISIMIPTGTDKTEKKVKEGVEVMEALIDEIKEVQYEDY